MLDMRKFGDLALQRDHVVVQLGVEGVGIAPVEVGLSVIVSIHRRVDVEPVALVPYQWLAQGVLEGSVGGVGLQYGDAMTVEWGIEVVLPIALHRLDGPGSVLTTAPGNVLQRSHGSMLRPVHHVGGAPQ